VDDTVSLDHAELAAALPLERIDVAQPGLFRDDAVHPYFARLRRDAPLHHCEGGMFGPYWSVTRYRDIIGIEAQPELFSSHSQFGGITIRDRPPEHELPMFIAMDPPQHGPQRAGVQPVADFRNLAALEPLIRARVAEILDGLPRGETFNWVDRVSIELTVRMLATLFDIPQEDRRRLSHWSDVATALPMPGGLVEDEVQREAEFAAMLDYFVPVWNARVNAPPRPDLISMLAHAPATRDMSARVFMGNLILLIVGGNDTTRNSISGGVLFFHENPEEYARLKADPSLLDSAVGEIIRFQTPLAHMRRTALADVELHGQTIRKGDKVVMWYLSGNRDERAIDEPDRFLLGRERPRKHLSFGFGIHRCVGSRIAELQLRLLWEEILRRDLRIEVVGPPVRTFSVFVHGFTELPVRIAP
jgi:cytochrome P450